MHDMTVGVNAVIRHKPDVNWRLVVYEDRKLVSCTVQKRMPFVLVPWNKFCYYFSIAVVSAVRNSSNLLAVVSLFFFSPFIFDACRKHLKCFTFTKAIAMFSRNSINRVQFRRKVLSSIFTGQLCLPFGAFTRVSGPKVSNGFSSRDDILCVWQIDFVLLCCVGVSCDIN